ncbi:hypothetical protein GCM10008983_01630 [Lentibacillus halophilus]|uniref:Uncharacterized protein n=1 Tax=Lentibacillus halophilus TaxID=295065 RepID=A0ABN0Z1N2_9BACI
MNEPSYKAVKIFSKEVEEGYPTTKSSLAKIDELWKSKMKPFIEQLP